jgi:hypothetical protein
MPASSVAIALALRKNRSLGKTFWFTDPNIQIPIIDNFQFYVNLCFLILGFKSTGNKFSLF